MLTKKECIEHILAGHRRKPGERGKAFAPANIALCKYWGKRNEELNLPVTSSLSISLGRLGTQTTVTCIDASSDAIVLNGNSISSSDLFAQRLVAFLDLFRLSSNQRFYIDTTNTIPTAAGLASSASGFAALVLALDHLMNWDLDQRTLSILARIGSGSASRSMYNGFAQWHRGSRNDGLDSVAEPLDTSWPALRIATVLVSESAKPIDSRSAMRRTCKTSRLYESWPSKVAEDLVKIHEAIHHQDFNQLGQTAESNALSMHATMIASSPPILYWLPESVERLHQVWALRAEGLPLYFTMDAGPNLKLLFEAQNEDAVRAAFPCCEVIAPFSSTNYPTTEFQTSGG